MRPMPRPGRRLPWRNRSLPPSRRSKAVESIVGAVEQGLDKLQQLAEDGFATLTGLVATAVDWIEANLPDPIDWIVNDLLPAGWGLLKLAAGVALLISAWPAALAAALICNLVAEHYRHEDGTVAEAILSGDPRYHEMHVIARPPARATTSSFPDSTAGRAQTRWTWRSSTAPGSSTRRCSNITAWKTGRSSRTAMPKTTGCAGAAPTASRMTPQRSCQGRILTRPSCKRASWLPPSPIWPRSKEYPKVYGLLRALFHDKGRYYRTVGNHDDINIAPELAAALGRVFPGLRVLEYIVLTDGRARWH